MAQAFSSSSTTWELAVATGLVGPGGRVAEADPELVDDALVAADLLTGALTLRGGEAALHQPAGDHDTVAGGQALGHVLGGRAERAGVEVGGLAVLPVAGLGVAAARRPR
jgi:hypothetical protein